MGSFGVLLHLFQYNFHGWISKYVLVVSKNKTKEIMTENLPAKSCVCAVTVFLFDNLTMPHSRKQPWICADRWLENSVLYSNNYHTFNFTVLYLYFRISICSPSYLFRVCWLFRKWRLASFYALLGFLNVKARRCVNKLPRKLQLKVQAKHKQKLLSTGKSESVLTPLRKGKQASDAKRGKTSKRRQTRENAKTMPSAGKHANDTKRGKHANDANRGKTRIRH